MVASISVGGRVGDFFGGDGFGENGGVEEITVFAFGFGGGTVLIGSVDDGKVNFVVIRDGGW